MSQDLDQLASQAAALVAAAGDERELDELRVRFLGRKSQLRTALSRIGQLPPAERPAAGAVASRTEKAIQAAIEARQEALRGRAASPPVDVTLPGRPRGYGRPHPLTALSCELVDICAGMGFAVASGPEVEDEYHNFDALNTPADHPARDLQATFYLDSGLLLRTQTSTVQIRVMEQTRPPVRIVAPGRCYRRDALDATHHFAFHQIEGLYVDRGVSLADLKGTIQVIAQRLLGEDVRVRFRPHFFPFTEPSVEYDFSCSLCRGPDPACPVCKGTGWIEVAGAGMVDPAVFEAVGYDPEEFTGFAFGVGLERVAMIRHGIDDIRLFLENDLRFLRQF